MGNFPHGGPRQARKGPIGPPNWPPTPLLRLIPRFPFPALWLFLQVKVSVFPTCPKTWANKQTSLLNCEQLKQESFPTKGVSRALSSKIQRCQRESWNKSDLTFKPKALLSRWAHTMGKFSDEKLWLPWSENDGSEFVDEVKSIR